MKKLGLKTILLFHIPKLKHSQKIILQFCKIVRVKKGEYFSL